MSDLIIKSGNIVNPGGEISGVHDIYIKSGNIIGIDEDTAKLNSPKIIDAEDCIVSPGLVDLSVRFREPGLEKEATILSESKAAVSSGVTTVCYMPDTQPVIDTPAQIKLVEEIFKNVDLCKVKVLASLTKGLQGESLSPMMELKQAGAKGLTNCFNPIKDSLVLRRVMEYASGQDITIFYQPQNSSLANNGCVHEGKVSNKLGLPGIPSAAESVAVAEAILLSKLTNSRLHLCRISCVESLILIKNAQSSGLLVTADVAIHQLYFDENSINNFNSDFHVIPPFRSNEDLIALQKAISKDTITAICSDHQPHNADAKQAPFSDTQPGISSIELLLPLLMELVNLKILDLNTAIAKVTSNPSKILGIEAGIIKKGVPADLCIIKKEEWIFDEAKIFSAGKNNPFIGKKFNTLVDKTICNGRIVYEKK
tara:strand:- start:44 stop:1321 length:1278 start_codon:yes stop_codon:yes gene_type:complete